VATPSSSRCSPGGATLVFLFIGLVAGCASGRTDAPQVNPGAPGGQPTLVQPGRPGEESKTVAPETSVRNAALPHTAADTRFMQGMIGHHAQALEMAALVYTNSQSEEMKLLAKRIEVSQIDEINMMKEWLTARREKLPDEHAHHAGDHALMPGMLTQAEMKALTAAKGVEFDRLFLIGMIKHHQGALTMVKELFATPGAGQDAEIFAFASDVDADQSMEIDRMSAMLAALKAQGRAEATRAVARKERG
jgi:uncharacterized protein (DUF305 family)